MNAGIDQWGSADQEDEEQSEDSEFDEAVVEFLGSSASFEKNADAIQFEMLLEQFAEENNNRRGVSAAANWCDLSILQRSHAYQKYSTTATMHASVINHESFHVLDYMRSKQATTNECGIHGVEYGHQQETVEISVEAEVEGIFNALGDTMESNVTEHVLFMQHQPNYARGRYRWLFAAAASVVSLVSLALVLCFTNLASS
ncbi:LOW QUALITY PROTEIN: hypothetical protein U9M48_034779, partial [Paspalum notatum var. saurae]